MSDWVDDHFDHDDARLRGEQERAEEDARELKRVALGAPAFLQEVYSRLQADVESISTRWRERSVDKAVVVRHTEGQSIEVQQPRFPSVFASVDIAEGGLAVTVRGAIDHDEEDLHDEFFVKLTAPRYARGEVPTGPRRLEPVGTTLKAISQRILSPLLR